MKISKQIGLYATSAVLFASITLVAFAQNYGAINASTTARFRNLSSTTRLQMEENASSTRAANIASMMQKAIVDADKEITARINSLNNLISKIESIKNVSDADKANIASTTQNEIATLTALKAQIDSDTSTTTMRDDLKSITGDYRIYALIEPQIEILTAADRINQIVSLMTIVENKLQARIAQLQSSGVDTSSLSSAMSDIASKIADATSQAGNAVSSTASLVPDQGNATVAASNAVALKAARADIKTGNSDLQTARKDMNTVLSGIRSITPRESATTSTTVSGTSSAQ